LNDAHIAPRLSDTASCAEICFCHPVACAAGDDEENPIPLEMESTSQISQCFFLSGILEFDFIEGSKKENGYISAFFPCVQSYLLVGIEAWH